MPGQRSGMGDATKWLWNISQGLLTQMEKNGMAIQWTGTNGYGILLLWIWCTNIAKTNRSKNKIKSDSMNGYGYGIWG